MNDIRYDGIVGMIEEPAYVHFSEYWSGEGLDFVIGEKDQKTISLSIYEIEAVVLAAYVSGFVNLDAIKQIGELMKREAKNRKKELKSIRNSNI